MKHYYNLSKKKKFDDNFISNQRTKYFIYDDNFEFNLLNVLLLRLPSHTILSTFQKSINSTDPIQLFNT